MTLRNYKSIIKSIEFGRTNPDFYEFRSCVRGVYMKYLRQLLIITFIAFIGETLNHFIDLPIPGSIYGLVLMFLALNARIIRIEHINETARFLLEIMPILFIPPAANLVGSWDAVKAVLVPGTLISCITTVVGMVVVGIVTQAVIRHDAGKKESK